MNLLLELGLMDEKGNVTDLGWEAFSHLLDKVGPYPDLTPGIIPSPHNIFSKFMGGKVVPTACEMVLYRKDGKVFLTPRDDNTWKGVHFPGSYISPRENPLTTCQRIADREKLGVKILEVVQVGAQSAWNSPRFHDASIVWLVTEWTGDSTQPIPTLSRRTALWAQRTYADLADAIARIRAGAHRHGLGRIKLGVLFVGWAHVVWPPELKIYDFDSAWYARHPELYAPPKSIINMPDLHPVYRLHADTYPYAAFPRGLAEDTYFPKLIDEEWEVVNQVDYFTDEKHQYDFSILELQRI